MAGRISGYTMERIKGEDLWRTGESADTERKINLFFQFRPFCPARPLRRARCPKNYSAALKLPDVIRGGRENRQKPVIPGDFQTSSTDILDRNCDNPRDAFLSSRFVPRLNIRAHTGRY